MDAIGFAMVGIGGYLMYTAVKGEKPWAIFQQAIGIKKPGATVAPGGPPGPAVLPATNITDPSKNIVLPAK